MDTSTQLYATETDAEWRLPEPLLPAEAPTERPRRHSRRILLNAIFYALRSVVDDGVHAIHHARIVS